MRHFGDAVFTTWSGGHEPCFQRVKLGVSKHLPFDHFKSIDVAFGTSVAELQHGTGFDSGIVAADALGEAH